MRFWRYDDVGNGDDVRNGDTGDDGLF